MIEHIWTRQAKLELPANKASPAATEAVGRDKDDTTPSSAGGGLAYRSLKTVTAAAEQREATVVAAAEQRGKKREHRTVGSLWDEMAGLFRNPEPELATVLGHPGGYA